MPASNPAKGGAPPQLRIVISESEVVQAVFIRLLTGARRRHVANGYTEAELVVVVLVVLRTAYKPRQPNRGAPLKATRPSRWDHDEPRHNKGRPQSPARLAGDHPLSSGQ